MPKSFIFVFFLFSFLNANAACLEWPSGIVPFNSPDSLYYITGPNSNGDQLVVGRLSFNTYESLRSTLPLPSSPNQQFCGSVELAPNVYAQVYVPTDAEWDGDYSAFAGALIDPRTKQPFPGGIIPAIYLSNPFALRISTRQGASSTASPPLRFIPVPPCRVADTRSANSSLGGPMLVPQTTRDFPIPNSSCGIPANAQAYSLNFTVVPQGTLNYITAFPTGQLQPFVSTLNSYDGRIKANAAILPAGTNGAISVFATDSTQLIIDINGYFVPATNATALAYYPVTPCRLVDTRGTAGPFGAPSLSGGQERMFPVLASACCVPAAAQAYSLNYTVVPKGPLEYLTTWPTGQTRPRVSTLNAPTGTITANAAIVPAGTGGDVSVYATADTDIILDINGYFAPPAAGGLSFYTLAPCRAYDSRIRPGGLPLVDTTAVNIVGSNCGAPGAAKSFVLNATAVPTPSLLYLSLWADGGTGRPNVSVLNAPDGTVTSNLALVPTTAGSTNAFGSASTQLILDLFGYFAP